MLKSKNIFKRGNGKKLGAVVFGLIALLSSLAAVITCGFYIGEQAQADKVINEYTQTQEFKDVLREDYNFITQNVETEDISNVVSRIETLDSKEYKKIRLMDSKNEALIEKYNNKKKTASNLLIATGALAGAGYLIGGLSKGCQDDYKKEKENEEKC